MKTASRIACIIQVSSSPVSASSLRALLGIIILASLSSCAAAIDRNELLRELQNGTQPLIVDVRSKSEFERDHIPGALSVPFYSVASGLQAAGYSKKDRVVLYCEHGPRAGLAALVLSLSGYDKIFSLEGHMRGWRQAEFPREIIVH